MKVKRLMILVLPNEQKERTQGGIILPASVDKMADTTGVVKAVGKDSAEYDMDLKVNDKIIFMDKPNHIEVGENKLFHIEDVLMVL